MKDLYMTNADLFPNKVNIYLYMFGSLMLDWIFGKVECEDIIIINHRGLTRCDIPQKSLISVENKYI